MARLSDLRFSYMLFMKAYPYRQYGWRPGGAPLRKPLREARIAVVTTAALYRPDQKPFDETFRGGDFSWREIPASTDLCTLRIAHKSDAFDDSGIVADKNVALPLDRLRELAAERQIGSLHDRQFSFMGSISTPSRLVRVTAPEVAAALQGDGVDAVLLTPL